MIINFPGRARRGETRDGGDGFARALLDQLPRLRRYAIALVGDVSLADDLVQDCAERALRRSATLSDVQSLYPWLRTILHNLFMDELRRRRARGVQTDVEQLANVLALSVPPADREAAMDMARALALVSAEHRQILLLVGLEGASYSDIARELAIPLGTVMSRLARAREQLRIRLEQDVELGKPARTSQTARKASE
jgi:RNA polymerase sigma-70 factor (ECF subfamily)